MQILRNKRSIRLAFLLSVELLTSLSSSSLHSYFFCLFFNNMFQNADPTQQAVNPVSLPSFRCMQDIRLFRGSV